MKSKQQHRARFDLIKSMTKAVKRRFKLAYSQTRSNQDQIFLKLFDLVVKQKTPDDDELISKEPAITRQQLPNLKRYLYHHILRSLNDQYIESDIERRAQLFLGHIKTLFDRNLFPQCQVMINQAKHFAEKYELRHLQHQLFSWEDRLQITNIDRSIKKFDDKLEHQIADDRKKDKDRVAETIKKESDLYYLRNQVFISIRKERFTRQSLLADFQGELEKHPIFKKHNDTDDGFRNKYLRHVTLGIYYITLGEYRRSYGYFKKVIKLIEQYPHFIETDERMYGVALYNFALNCVRMDVYDDYFRACLEKLNIEANKGNIPLANAQCLELVYYSSRGEFVEGIPVADRIVKQISDQGAIGNFIIEMDLYFDLMYVYFGAGKYEFSLEWLNRIIQSKAINVVRDLYNISRMVQLIIHFELGNKLLLESLSKSHAHYLKARKAKHQFEDAFISFFQKISQTATGEPLTPFFKQLQQQVTGLEHDSTESRMFEYFDFTSWLESKISGRSFGEVVRGNYGGE